jgi:hypothetical protein
MKYPIQKGWKMVRKGNVMWGDMRIVECVSSVGFDVKKFDCVIRKIKRRKK